MDLPGKLKLKMATDNNEVPNAEVQVGNENGENGHHENGDLERKSEENGIESKVAEAQKHPENGDLKRKSEENGIESKIAEFLKGPENGELKRKADENGVESKVTEFQKEPESEPVEKKPKLVEVKCAECSFKCYDEAMLKTHQMTTHGQVKKMKQCNNCAFTCAGVWEMDFHCRSRGHKAKKDDSVPCKKCDYICQTPDDVWAHKKVHIPPEKLLECADCVWVGDRLDNIRYHAASKSHKMKGDYEAIALAKAEAKGPKDVAAYHKKLAKDLKNAMKGCKA